MLIWHTFMYTIQCRQQIIFSIRDFTRGNIAAPFFPSTLIFSARVIFSSFACSGKHQFFVVVVVGGMLSLLCRRTAHSLLYNHRTIRSLVLPAVKRLSFSSKVFLSPTVSLNLKYVYTIFLLFIIYYYLIYIIYIIYIIIIYYSKLEGKLCSSLQHTIVRGRHQMES